MVQAEAFSKELKLLKQKQFVSKQSSIIKLYPFLDQEDIIRVGGLNTAYFEKMCDLCMFPSILLSTLMGELPKYRIEVPLSPFINAVVGYAGPCEIVLYYENPN